MSDIFAGTELARKPQEPSNAIFQGTDLDPVRSQALARVETSVEANPDHAAKAIAIGNDLEVDPAEVALDHENFGRLSELKNNSQVVAQSIPLQKYINSSPLAAAVSKDDFPLMAKVGVGLTRMLSGEMAGSVLSALTKGFGEGFQGQQFNEEFAKLRSTVGYQALSATGIPQVATGIDLLMRGFTGATYGAAGAVGEFAGAFGAEAPDRLVRDLVGLSQVAVPELARGIHPEAVAIARTAEPYVAAGKEPPAALHPMIDAAKVEQTKGDLQVLTEALTDTQASKTRERDPALYADFIRQVTEGDVGVSVDAVKALYGDKIPEPGDGILGWVPRIREQLAEAEATGGDINIPIADWLTYIDPKVAQGLQDFIRTRPDGVTIAEAGIEAYHGTPHDFEAFDLGKVGAGEGAQSFGHGLYFAENPEVAKEYQTKLGGDKGNQYKVRIKVNPDDLLDWDRPLSEQPDAVLETLAKVGGTTPEALRASPLNTGDWLNAAGGGSHGFAFSTPKEMSAALHEAGIPGIKYLDQGSRDSGTGTRNFVIFDDKLIEIIEKNGEAVRAVRQAAALPMSEREAFAKAQAIGMNKAQYDLYQRQIAKQTAEDAERQMRRATEAERKRQTREWKENEKVEREAATEEVNALPAVKADKFFRLGELDGEVLPQRPKIDPRYLDETEAQRLPQNFLGQKGGMSPDDAAALVGLSDGKSLLAELTAFTEARKASGLRPDDFQRRLIKAQTDARMEAKYGNLQENILREAKEQVLTPTQLELLAEETVALAEKTGQQLPIAEIKRAAERDILETPIKQVSSDRFLADAGRAGRAMEMALLKGDAMEAFRQKQRQFIATVKAREALGYEDAREALDKTAKTYSVHQIKTIDQAYLNYIQQLLTDVGYKLKVTPDEIQRSLEFHNRGSLTEFVNEAASFGYDQAAPDGYVAKPLERMTLGEFNEFKDVIDELVFQGKDVQKIELRGQKADFAKWRAEVIDNIRTLPLRSEEAQRKGGRWLYNLEAPWTRTEEIIKDLDLRKDLGPLYDAIMIPYNTSKIKELDMLRALSAKFQEIHSKVNAHGQKWERTFDQVIPQDFIIDSRNQTVFKLTRWNMIKMMLNWGNESNAKKLVNGIATAALGERPSKEIAQFFHDKIDTLIKRHANPEDWQFVQQVWDIFEGWKKDVDTLSRNTSGRAPKWVEPRPIETPHGTFAGGYFPLMRDPLRTIPGDFTREQSNIKTSGPLGENFFRAKTMQSQYIERTGANYFVDISGGMENIVGRMQQVIHDIAYRDFVIQAGKVLYDPQISSVIKNHYGVEYQRQLVPWLERVANVNNAPEKALAGWNDTLQQIRYNLMASALPLNYSVMFSPSVGTLNLKRMMEFNANRAANVKLVFENSQELRHTLYSLDRDIAEQMKRATGTRGLSSFQASAMEKMLKPLVWMEQQFRMVTFYSEFMKQKELGRTNFEAGILADSKVRERHVVSAPGDLPAMLASKSEFVKLSTLFMGYFTAQRNWLRQVPGDIRRGEYDEAAKAIWGTVGVGTLFNAALFTKRKEDDTFWSFMAKAVGTIPMSMIPFARNIWGYYTEGYKSVDPILSMGLAVGNTIKDGVKIYEGKRPKSPLKNLFTAAGQAAGVPGALQMGRTFEFLNDMRTGEQRPRDIIEFMRGIATGEAKLRKR